MHGPWADGEAAWVDGDAAWQPRTASAALGRAVATLAARPAAAVVWGGGGLETVLAALAVATAQGRPSLPATVEKGVLAATPRVPTALLATTGPCGNGKVRGALSVAAVPLAAPRCGVLGLRLLPTPAGTDVAAQALPQAVAALLTAHPCLAGTGIREVARLASPVTTAVRLASPVTPQARLATSVTPSARLASLVTPSVRLASFVDIEQT